MNERLTVDFTLQELKTALRDMPSDKAPGHDTIPKELLQELWDDIGDDILSYIQESLDSGHIDNSIKYGVTSLIPKDGSLTLIKNF